jgi:hypothetical protein
MECEKNISEGKIRARAVSGQMLLGPGKILNFRPVQTSTLDSLSEGLPVKSSNCLILGEAAQCSVSLSCSHFSTLSPPTHGEIKLAGSGPRNGLLDPSIAKPSASSLPWISQWPVTQKSVPVTLFQPDRAHNAYVHSQTTFDVTNESVNGRFAPNSKFRTLLPPPPRVWVEAWARHTSVSHFGEYSRVLERPRSKSLC